MKRLILYAQPFVKNKTTYAARVRVVWQDICKPKAERGLGIRPLEEFEVVFRLKQLWSFFANACSLWVAWLEGNIFHRKSYWITDDSNRLSKIVKSMLQLKPVLAEFI